ncbi:MAG: SH3 domain-containing protein [Vicinamibacterales bacterium]
MIRHAAAIAVALLLTPAWLHAQNPEFTVNVQSANVYKGPSTGSPVIGKAPRGTVLEVTRDLGDWLKVTWPSVPDSAGYVHITTGARSRPMASDPLPVTSPAYVGRPARASLAPANLSYASPETDDSRGSLYVTPRTHIVGLGGRMAGSTLGYGGTVRGWSRKRLGIQLEVSRYSISSADTLGRVTSLEFAPSALYSLPDRVGDYVWFRPYVGGGANLHRATQTGFGSTNKVGFQAFGGGEATFASFPQFAVSADLGYRWTRAPYDGFDLSGLRVSVSGHWYLK